MDGAYGDKEARVYWEDRPVGRLLYTPSSSDANSKSPRGRGRYPSKARGGTEKIASLKRKALRNLCLLTGS